MPFPTLAQLEAHHRDPREEAAALGILPGQPTKPVQQDKPKKKPGARPKNAHVVVNKSCISFSKAAFAWMDAKKVEVRYARYKDSVIVTFTPSKKGIKVYDYFSRPAIVSRPVLEQLFAKGVEMGVYQLCKHKTEEKYFAIPL